jgi:hypothetical protein
MWLKPETAIKRDPDVGCQQRFSLEIGSSDRMSVPIFYMHFHGEKAALGLYSASLSKLNPSYSRNPEGAGGARSALNIATLRSRKLNRVPQVVETMKYYIAMLNHAGISKRGA